MTTMAMITKMIIAMKEYVVCQGFISKGTPINKSVIQIMAGAA